MWERNRLRWRQARTHWWWVQFRGDWGQHVEFLCVRYRLVPFLETIRIVFKVIVSDGMTWPDHWSTHGTIMIHSFRTRIFRNDGDAWMISKELKLTNECLGSSLPLMEWHRTLAIEWSMTEGCKKIEPVQKCPWSEFSYRNTMKMNFF